MLFLSRREGGEKEEREGERKERNGERKGGKEEEEREGRGRRELLLLNSCVHLSPIFRKEILSRGQLSRPHWSRLLRVERMRSTLAPSQKAL